MMENELTNILEIRLKSFIENKNNSKTKKIFSTLQNITQNHKNTKFQNFLNNIKNLSSDCFTSQYEEEKNIVPCINYIIKFENLGVLFELRYTIVYLVKLQEIECEKNIFINKEQQLEEINLNYIRNIFNLHDIDDDEFYDFFTKLFSSFITVENLLW
jgi:hypothetical protein